MGIILFSLSLTPWILRAPPLGNLIGPKEYTHSGLPGQTQPARTPSSELADGAMGDLAWAVRPGRRWRGERRPGVPGRDRPMLDGDSDLKGPSLSAIFSCGLLLAA